MAGLELSYVHGASDQPLIGKTVGQFFDEACAKWASRPALVVRHQNVRLSYGELRQAVDKLAAGLLTLGLNPGDRIGIWSPNNSEWVLTQFATAKAGLILVNINPSYRVAELEYALVKVGCKALILAERFKTSDYIGMLRELAPELGRTQPGELESKRLPSLRSVVLIGEAWYPGTFRFSEIMSRGGAAEAERIAALGPQLQFDEPINIQFTSGTTGFPKGATLSHHNILNNGFFIGEAMRLTPDDRLCIPVPLYHCFGMVLGVLAAVTHAAASVFPAEGFDPLLTLRTVERERCTALHGVPTMFIAELEHPQFASFDLTSLRTGIMAGAPCPIAVMRRVITDMHMPEVTICYGMTETSPVSFQSACDDPIERRVATVGRIHPHVQVKIVDAAGRTTERGTSGELLTRGYSVMRGYWSQPERTAEAIDEGGWMRTGDLAVLDEEGYCNIVGRVKDMIIRGGENIYPREIEEFLYRHPAVLDIAVVGIPDHRYGEEICACIRLRDGVRATEEDIREFCRGQIAHYKVPRYVRFMDSFPQTVTGKIQKYLLREQLQRELGLVPEKHA